MKAPDPKLLSRVGEALVEPLVMAEMEDALEVLSDAVEADDAGIYRFPRASVGDLGERLLALSKEDPLFARLASAPGRQIVAAAFEHGHLVHMPLSGTFGQRAGSGVALLLKIAPSEAVLELIAAVQTLFVGAYRRIERFSAMSGHNNALEALIEQSLGACAALAHPSGDIIWMSKSARRVLGDEGVPLLAERLREAAHKQASEEAVKFTVNLPDKHRLYGTLRFVREVEKASIHHVIVELHGSEVEDSSDEAMLTPSEREIYGDVRDGLSNEQIATKRHVSVHTVRSHMKRMFKKLGISSRIEIITKHKGGR